MATLEKLTSRFLTQSAATLDRKRDGLRQDLASFRREHRVFADRAHAAVDESIERLRLELVAGCDRFAALQSPITLDPVPPGMTNPSSVFVHLGTLVGAVELLPAYLHAAVDRAEAAGAFSKLTYPEFVKEESRRLREISAIEVELEKRGVESARATELEELEQRAAARIADLEAKAQTAA